MTIDAAVRCVNQVFRPQIFLKIDGMGDCLICTYDPDNNDHCRCYYPLRIYYFEVTENTAEARAKLVENEL